MKTSSDSFPVGLAILLLVAFVAVIGAAQVGMWFWMRSYGLTAAESTFGLLAAFAATFGAVGFAIWQRIRKP